MKAITRYFTNDAKALKAEVEIHELQKEIRQLRKKQKIFFTNMRKDDAEIRQMFNNGAFKSYSDMTDIYYSKLFSK